MPGAESIVVRPASASDQATIRALVRQERLNPAALDWPNFLVAADAFGVVGIVQMRRHEDGANELASLVVAAGARGRGVATRMIDALLAMHPVRVQMVTDLAHAAHYRRWGFQAIAPAHAPASVRRIHAIGCLACMLSLVRRRPRKRLVILERAGGPAVPAAVRQRDAATLEAD